MKFLLLRAICKKNCDECCIVFESVVSLLRQLDEKLFAASTPSAMNVSDLQFPPHLPRGSFLFHLAWFRLIVRPLSSLTVKYQVISCYNHGSLHFSLFHSRYSNLILLLFHSCYFILPFSQQLAPVTAQLGTSSVIRFSMNVGQHNLEFTPRVNIIVATPPFCPTPPYYQHIICF